MEMTDEAPLFAKKAVNDEEITRCTEDASTTESANIPVLAPFRVDVSVIPQAASKDAGVLDDLGLQVFNQEDLEAGVVAQAEQRMEESNRVAQHKRSLQSKSRFPVVPRKEAPADKPSESSSAPSTSNAPHLTAFERYLADQERRIKKKKEDALSNRNFLPTARTGKRNGESRDWSAPTKSSRGLLPGQARDRKRRKKSHDDDASSSRSNEISEDVSDGEVLDDETDEAAEGKRAARKNSRIKDDADSSVYLERIREYQNGRLQKDQEKAARDTADGGDVEEEEEFLTLSGGLKMPREIWTGLYAYQRTGVKWLWELHNQEVGGILGDEMGLGKTVQIIALLAALQYSRLYDRSVNMKGLGPVLIICPATVLHQWVNEFHKWWPPARVAILHASGSHSGSKMSLVKSMVKCSGVIVTTYQGVLSYQVLLLKQDWHYVVLDEGHKIRNPDSQITVACKQFRTPHRIICSGSPMQNNLRELWSLMDFIFPGKLGLLNVFLEQFSVPIIQGSRETASDVQVHTAYKCATALKNTITPYLLRRSKADVKVAIQLPEKNEQVLFCQLTDHQRQLYQEYLQSDELRNVIHGDVQIFVGLMQLRKLCNHPDLFDGGPKVFLDVKTKKPLIDDEEAAKFGYWRRSGKMVVVEALLKMWKKQSHKTLIFSQSRKMLDIMADFLDSNDYTFLRMDGETPIARRQSLIRDFNQDPDIFCFLLTTRVGGLGVNLTGASRVIIFDPDWNPSTDTQARERAWRIGQKKNVTIYRLLCAGTIEEKIYHRQIFKQYLTNRVLKDPKQKRFFKHNDLYELFTLSTPGKDEITETAAAVDLPPPATSSASAAADPARDRLKQLAKAISSKIGQASTSQAGNLNTEIPQLTEASKDRKKTKRRKNMVDGAVITGLAKTEAYQNPADETEEERKKNEDYVLQTLFKKTTAHSAVPYEEVANGTQRDHAIVEEEAQKVAQEAMRMLRLSRKRCHPATSGVPNYSGDIKVVPVKPSAEPAEKEEKTSFNEDDDSNDEVPMSAASLLTRIRHNVAVMNDGVESNSNHSAPSFADSDEEGGGRADQQRPYVNFAQLESGLNEADESESFASTEQLAIAERLVAFLNHDTTIPGQATTEVLVNKFQKELPAQEANLFRAILKGVCDFEKKRRGPGVWILKQEYRDYR
ncbi:hypothetical protein RvY_00602 [Ramazzottius varieornatus]|uniref:DNA repair and recombination protein RAD54-like n=1 Tax=Ramazzottius varieornatus TaxID=947166 RepID=A0A1D1UDC2_RAMVA|nr:hypothetical protein RvY_00602 [Ramazzottius varieornatus]